MYFKQFFSPRWSERSKLTNESVKSEWFCVYSPRKSRITLQFLSANLQHAQAILFKGKSAFFPLTAEHLKLLFTGEFNSAKVLLGVNLTCISWMQIEPDTLRCDRTGHRWYVKDPAPYSQLLHLLRCDSQDTDCDWILYESLKPLI